MEKKTIPPEVAGWIDHIKKNVMSDPMGTEEFLVQLEKYAKENRSDYLKGCFLLYRGYQNYALSRLQKSMEFLSQALNYSIAVEDWYQTAKIYNAMGNIADFQGDASLAIDCYIKGLVLCRENGLIVTEYDISSNLANAYISLSDPVEALKILNQCERIQEQANGQIPLVSETVVKANIAQCSIQLGDYSRAAAYMESIRETMADDGDKLDAMSMYILETQLYHALGEAGKRDDAICHLHEIELNSINILDALNELCRHANLLLKLGKIDEFLALVRQIEGVADNPSVEKQVMELWLDYYETVGDEDSLARMAVQYYKVARQRDEERNRIVCHNITTRITLCEEEARRKEVEKSNLLLKQKSERDALTGMNNRYKLNEIAELAFHKAYMNGSPLTVEILDIDCYKEFNDNYGHQAGDECLIKIADAIRSMEEFTGVHSARYGGDEFVIIYEDYTRQDVEKMAKRLKERIHSLNIEHKYSRVSDRVTISQGLFHKIPSGGNKTWDFLYGADMALYGVKNRTRNSYYVGTSFDEVRAYSKGNQ